MRGLLVVLTLVGCAAEPRSMVEPGVCDGDEVFARSTADRHIIGQGATWAADGTLRERDAELAGSMALRREVGWHVIRRAVAPAPVAADLPGSGTIPAWQTWYDIDDIRRMFDRLYVALPAADRTARVPFSDAELDAAFLWNPTAVSSDASWPEERLRAHLESLDSDARIAGLGGLTRTAYNGPAARHILSSYAEILACRDDGAPPADAVGADVVVPVARHAVSLEGCGAEVVGSYTVQGGESLVVALDGPGRVATRAGTSTCTTTSGEPACVVEGPTTVEVEVRAGAEPVDAVVDVSRQHVAPPAWAGCLVGPFPNDAVIVKADYRRADFSLGMPVYDTSADALPGRLATSWDTPDGSAQPLPHEAYTLELPSGAQYQVTALHVMTKELDHWLWATMWWSDDADADFGADRPEDIEGPWDHYKMCTVTAFDEGDPEPWAGVSDASLAAALRATHAGASWCSNPFLEQGHGNAETNCVGCHQHGGATDLESQAILELPDRGRVEIRNNFPADYAWSVTHGEDLQQLFAEREFYYGTVP